MSKLGSNRSRANTAAADSPGLRGIKREAETPVDGEGVLGTNNSRSAKRGRHQRDERNTPSTPTNPSGRSPSHGPRALASRTSVPFRGRRAQTVGPYRDGSSVRHQNYNDPVVRFERTTTLPKQGVTAPSRNVEEVKETVESVQQITDDLPRSTEVLTDIKKNLQDLTQKLQHTPVSSRSEHVDETLAVLHELVNSAKSASKHASKSLQRATIVTDHLNNLDERDTKGVEYADSSIKELLKANSMRLEEINHKIEVTDIRNAARHTVLYNGVKDTFVLLKKIHQQLQVNDEPSNPEEILKKNQGNFEFALQQYMDALNESTTKEEAQQAAALCVQYSSNLFKHHLHF